MFPEGDTVIASKGVVLEWDEDLEGAAADEVASTLPILFSSMRHISGQFRLSATPRVESMAGLNDVELSRVWPNATEFKGYVREDLVHSAMSVDRMEEAVRLAALGGAPVYSTFFLDALRAHDVQDWRMALLLTAMAVETAAGEALAEWHGARLAAVPRSSSVVEVRRAGGTLLVDPVYDVLADRPGFKHILHERPLHLVGRSLLLADEPTYQRMLKLYAARNKISHLGAPAANAQSCYQLTRDNVEEAIDAAIRCFAFFGKQVTGGGVGRRLMDTILGTF
jgi:hypothetical protein